METSQDSAAAYLHSARGCYIEPINAIQSRQRMAELEARLEYNDNPDNIPTWASPELAVAMWKEKHKQENKQHPFLKFLKRLFLKLPQWM